MIVRFELSGLWTIGVSAHGHQLPVRLLRLLTRTDSLTVSVGHTSLWQLMTEHSELSRPSRTERPYATSTTNQSHTGENDSLSPLSLFLLPPPPPPSAWRWLAGKTNHPNSSLI